MTQREIHQRKIPGTSREAEETHLREIIEVAQCNLDKANESVEAMGQGIKELFESIDMREKEALILWNDSSIQFRQYKHDLDRFKKARSKPYFGRIDFQDPAVEFPESYYVGRVGIASDKAEPLVIDWRAPLASVYYENSLGKCQYNVSSEGTYEIELTRKRTYEIENDTLKDFFDSDVVANDDLLTKYLAKNKRAVLGEIIATIQKEQNLIIRRSPKTNIIVQGCAGSGKTTVAMHRISYILYNYADEFRPQDFYIIGSNKILLDYITGVLPDLDVHDVTQMTMEELFVRLIYEDWDPNKHSIRPLDKADEVNCVKGSNKWFEELDEFCWNYEYDSIPRDSVYLCLNDKMYSDKIMVGKNLIVTYCRDNSQLSMQAKILMLNEILWSKYENLTQGRYVSLTAKEKAALEKKYRNYFGKDDWKGDIFELYNKFLEEQNKKGYKVEIPQNHFDVYDLAALAFLYKRIKEIDPIREASHVVIDEAQDFGMMAYSCLHYCLNNCTYTIMGDTSQNIHFGYGLNDWEELRKLILTGTYDAFGLLKKSYRNTVEISDFATDILRHGDFSVYPVEPILRHGNQASVRAFSCREELLSNALKQIKDWTADGYETIAVVCRDEEETREVATALSKYIDIVDGSDTSARFGTGIMALPVAYTKGLEFDTVLLFNPTEEHYPKTNDYVKLLYVACTRALHELSVFYTGKLTGLIADPVPKGKHLTELYAETLSKAHEYEKVTFTQKELEEQERIRGRQEMKERNSIGPSRIKTQAPVTDNAYHKPKPGATLARTAPIGEKTISKATGINQPDTNESHNTGLSDAKRNPTPFPYGSIPDTAFLKTKGHSKADFSIRWIKKGNGFVDLASNCGVLRIEALTDQIIRVAFAKGAGSEIKANYWMNDPSPVKLDVRENRQLVEITTKEILIRVEKNNGAVQFCKKDGTVLLSENKTEPRFIENNYARVFFEWGKKERLRSKGPLKGDYAEIAGKARYVSYENRDVRMPFLLSGKGYGIGIVAEDTAMVCDVPAQGQYIHIENMNQTEYYFLLGKDENDSADLYQKHLSK